MLSDAAVLDPDVAAPPRHPRAVDDRAPGDVDVVVAHEPPVPRCDGRVQRGVPRIVLGVPASPAGRRRDVDPSVRLTLDSARRAQHAGGHDGRSRPAVDRPWSSRSSVNASNEHITSAAATSVSADSAVEHRQLGGERRPHALAEQAAAGGELFGDERLERRPEAGERADVAHRVEQAGALLDERLGRGRPAHRSASSSASRIGATSLQLTADRGAAEVVEVVEVAEDRARRQAGPGRDGIGAGGQLARPDELEHRVDDGVAVALAAQAAAVVGAHHRTVTIGSQNANAITAARCRACASTRTSRLSASAARAAATSRRVSAGSMTASMKPRSAATYGLSRRSA